MFLGIEMLNFWQKSNIAVSETVVSSLIQLLIVLSVTPAILARYLFLIALFSFKEISHFFADLS